jgi:hypothetical protein
MPVRDIDIISEYYVLRLSNWIFIGNNAYHEYTFVPWLGRSVYRRTVDLSSVTLL